MSKAPDPHAAFRAAARAKWGRADPFKLGMMVGEGLASLPPPEGYAAAARSLYADGIRAGRRDADSRLRQRQRIENAQRQVAAQYRQFMPRMVAECMPWHLHNVPGTLQFSLFRDDAVFDVPLPRVIENVQGMTEDRLLIKLARVIGTTNFGSLS